MGGIRFSQEQIDAIRLKNQLKRAPSAFGASAEVVIAAREPKKKRAKPRHLEDDLQMAEVEYVEAQYPQYADILIAIPNGGSRIKKKDKKGKWYSPEAVRLKKMGVKPGVLDLLFPLPRRGFHGLWIENKIGRNRLSPAQVRMKARLEGLGYVVVEVRTLDEFINAFTCYIALGA